MKLHILLLITTCVLFSCVKDKPNPDQYLIPNATHRGIVITNEGSFGNNNGELTFLDLETKTIFNQLFRTANNSSLGDIVQCISLINGKYYVAINNSNKIVVIDQNTFQIVTTISSVQSPRYIKQVSGDKAYVSCLYLPRVYVLNLNTNIVDETIEVKHPNTEQMLVRNNYCYVTNWDTASKGVYKINTTTDSIENEISLNGRSSHGIVEDKTGKLWILSGNKYKNKVSRLSRYNPITNNVEATFIFDMEDDPFRLIMNSTQDTLYYINVDYNGMSVNNGLYKMGIEEIVLPAKPFIRANENSYFWAVGIDAVTKNIFLSDPKGFTQSSTIYEYSSSGNLLNQFMAGIGANGFLFK